MLLVGEDLILQGQEGAAGIHQIDAGQAVLQGDLLGPQVFLDGEGGVGAALHRGVVGHHQALDAGNAPHPGNEGGRRYLVLAAVEAVGGELADFQEGRAGIEEGVHPLPRQQLAPGEMLLAGGFRAAQGDGAGFLAQIGHERRHGGGVGLEFGSAGIELGAEFAHGDLSGDERGVRPPGGRPSSRP